MRGGSRMCAPSQRGRPQAVGQEAYTGGNEFFTYHYDNLAALYARGDACENYQDAHGHRCMAARTVEGFFVGDRDAAMDDAVAQGEAASVAEAMLMAEGLSREGLAAQIANVLAHRKCLSGDNIHMNKNTLVRAQYDCSTPDKSLGRDPEGSDSNWWPWYVNYYCEDACRATPGCNYYTHSPGNTHTDDDGEGGEGIQGRCSDLPDMDRRGQCRWEQTADGCVNDGTWTNSGNAHSCGDFYAVCREDTVVADLRDGTRALALADEALGLGDGPQVRYARAAHVDQPSATNASDAASPAAVAACRSNQSWPRTNTPTQVPSASTSSADRHRRPTA